MSDKQIIGETGAVTGFETPDPKDSDPDTFYTTTPAENRVSSRDQSTYQAPQIPDAKEVTGQFDHLATRDIKAMEHAPQTPEYAGAANTEALGVSTDVLDTVTPNAGLGMPAGTGLAAQGARGSADQNPGYTPPSQMTPPHIAQHPAGQPSSAAVSPDTNAEEDFRE